jgi:hypothetical protein
LHRLRGKREREREREREEMADVVEKAWQRYLIALQKYPLRTKVSKQNTVSTYTYKQTHKKALSLWEAVELELWRL